MLTERINFTGVISVTNANPNGDPLNGNRPRQDYAGYGEISDVCIKRKIRNKLMAMHYPIFLQADDMCNDGCRSLRERADKCKRLKRAKTAEAYAEIACEEWADVRFFGQVFAFRRYPVTVGIRGPVSISPAFSLDLIDIASNQITKSANAEPGSKKGHDTMGVRHRVPHAAYVFHGGISPQLAQKTGFSDEDAEALQDAIIGMFDDDYSSARPMGSMVLARLYWWRQKQVKYSPYQLQQAALSFDSTDNWPYFTVRESFPADLTPEVYDFSGVSQLGITAP